MKENYNTSIKTKDFKIDYKITLTIQFIFMVLLLVGVIYYFIKESNILFIYIPAMIALLLGSYNTKKYLKKDKKAYLYLFGSVLVLINIVGVLL